MHYVCERAKKRHRLFLRLELALDFIPIGIPHDQFVAHEIRDRLRLIMRSDETDGFLQRSKLAFRARQPQYEDLHDDPFKGCAQTLEESGELIVVTV